MGKCSYCGNKGLFLKIGLDGLCADCHMAQLERRSKEITDQISDSEKLLFDAKEAAKTEAHAQLEKEYAKLKNEIDSVKSELIDVKAKRDAIAVDLDARQKTLDTVIAKTEKLKPIASSIKHAYETWITGLEGKESLRIIESLSLEDLLPTPDLNCLNIRQLKSRYTMLRKQIIDLCSAYENRYTTKANASIYKLMVLALEAEMENILHNLKYGKLDVGISEIRALTSKYYQIAVDGNQSIATTLKHFIGQIESLYLDVIDTEYEYYVQVERAKEEQRAIKEQMRQETEERKRLESERKKVESEELKYKQEIERITVQMQSTHDAELEKLKKRLEEMNALIAKVEEKKADIINLQNGKAGTVYIISNIGSFGDHVFKVGMTRRLEPQDRVNELGDASVPFPFDVHSFIFSEDAVALEAVLHHELNDRRVNKVNLRKEFFDISIEELHDLVEKIDPTAPFKMTALAEQYRQSQSIDAPEEYKFEIAEDE